MNYSINNATGQNKPDGNIVLDLVSGLPPFQFLWSNGDTTVNPGGLLPGDYVLSLTNAIGCLDTFHFKVDFIVKIMEKGGEKPAFVQPNPARDWAEIIWGDFDEWRLFNNMGQLAMTRQRGLSGGKIDLAGLPPGIYRYVFTKKDGGEKVGKLVVAMP